MTLDRASFYDDASSYLVHLVGKKDSYNNLMSILSSGRIRAVNAFGFLRKSNPQKSICFSEIPPKFLNKLVSRHGGSGIAFKKEMLISKGANRVWYLEKDGEQHKLIDGLQNNIPGNLKPLLDGLTPFIDLTGDFNGRSYRFDWEREWRLVGDLYFSPSDVSFLIIPGESHDAARSFFIDAFNDEVGPNYPCPFYDPLLNKITV